MATPGKPNVQEYDQEKVLEGGYFGALVGIDERSRVGFYGKDGTNQYNAIPTATDPATTMAAVNQILTMLRQKGLIKE